MMPPRPAPLEIGYDEEEDMPLTGGVGRRFADCWSRNSRYILGSIAIIAVCVIIIVALFAAQPGGTPNGGRPFGEGPQAAVLVLGDFGRMGQYLVRSGGGGGEMLCSVAWALPP